MTKPSGIRLAKRLDEVGFSDIVQIRNKVMEMRGEGLQVHALHGGEPYFETPEAIKYAAVKALVDGAKSGDVILTLGAGSVSQAGAMVLDGLGANG